MARQIVVGVVFNADGSMDSAATTLAFNTSRDTLAAQLQTDFDSVAVEVTTFLLANPALKTIPTSSLVRAIWDARIEAGEYAGKTREEKDAAFARLDEVVPDYVKANGDQFWMGRKTGIAIREVVGETVKDKDGADVYDAQGNTVQAYRHSAEEWTKITTPSPAALAKAAAKAAEEAAKAAKAAK